MINTSTLNPHIFEEIVKFLTDNAHVKDTDFTTIDKYVTNMTLFEAVDAYLGWNGIRGYTADILSIVDNAINNEVSNYDRSDRSDRNDSSDSNG